MATTPDATLPITGKVFIACSLDGFIARENGDIDWLNRYPDTGDDYGYASFMDTVDGLVMGRASYEGVLRFEDWPYTKPVVVLSSSLDDTSVPPRLRGKVRISNRTPRAIMQELAKEGWRAAYVDGGRLIQSFLAERLIGEMTITQIPVLLGRGRRLFGVVEQDIELFLEETRRYPAGFVQSRYRVGT
ncbi:dihydrofolate reductase family protein [Oricola cellulosilytica]|uniref:Dihydrofolate reductase n=1 Tax=Oricola cellulosilytica TaxID=1429082 RepID=A0A4R0PFL6_9HYPH|nr:dihydrofolate reductase family protein [Oricola cellulosilytica]TCD16431.1 dihydrofolate reductase [Oricola cellulosilytica]